MSPEPCEGRKGRLVMVGCVLPSNHDGVCRFPDASVVVLASDLALILEIHGTVPAIGVTWCRACHVQMWPCPTVRVLDALLKTEETK